MYESPSDVSDLRTRPGIRLTSTSVVFCGDTEVEMSDRYLRQRQSLDVHSSCFVACQAV